MQRGELQDIAIVVFEKYAALLQKAIEEKDVEAILDYGRRNHFEFLLPRYNGHLTHSLPVIVLDKEYDPRPKGPHFAHID